MRHTPFVATLAVLAAAAVPALAQGRVERAAFVVRLGADTLSVERFSRTGTRLEGELATRSPRTAYVRYTADLGINGSVTRFAVSIPAPGAPAGAPPLESRVASFTGDSIRIERRRGDTLQTTSVAVGLGAFPLLFGAYGPYELLTIRAMSETPDLEELFLSLA